MVERSRNQAVQTIAISEFKATCLEVLKRVKKTGRPLMVTRRGEPVAMVVAPPRSPNWIGSLVGSGSIKGDIVAPASDDEWEALS